VRHRCCACAGDVLRSTLVVDIGPYMVSPATAVPVPGVRLRNPLLRLLQYVRGVHHTRPCTKRSFHVAGNFATSMHCVICSTRGHYETGGIILASCCVPGWLPRTKAPTFMPFNGRQFAFVGCAELQTLHLLKCRCASATAIQPWAHPRGHGTRARQPTRTQATRRH
jgi:hypothetical protein